MWGQALIAERGPGQHPLPSSKSQGGAGGIPHHGLGWDMLIWWNVGDLRRLEGGEFGDSELFEVVFSDFKYIH